MIHKHARTRWFYNKFMKAQYNMESSFRLEKDMNGRTVFIVKLGTIYIRIQSDEVICSNPKDSTTMIVNYIKITNPEYFL